MRLCSASMHNISDAVGNWYRRSGGSYVWEGGRPVARSMSIPASHKHTARDSLLSHSVQSEMKAHDVAGNCLSSEKTTRSP